MTNLIENAFEYDLNPFMIFDSDAKLVKYNQEAEYLLSYVSSKEIFEFAMSCAPLNFGYKNTYVNIEFNRTKYYAILVGYEDDDHIVVKLYKEVVNSDFSIKENSGSKVSLYTLLELAINNTLDTNITSIKKEYDPSIPEIFLRVKEFLLLLNTILKEYKEHSELTIKVAVKIAENIVYKGKRYPVLSISFISPKKKIQNKTLLDKLAKDANCVVFLEDFKVITEFALVE